jgi:very-short-patch-repair endonuclease
MTTPERMLWKRLRGSPEGIAFRKQHPIDPYVADFYCASAKLVIELDGEVHNRGEQPQRDAGRDDDLRARGYHLVRISAADVLRDADEVAASIVACAADPLHHRASRGGPPPRERGGEGKP